MNIIETLKQKYKTYKIINQLKKVKVFDDNFRILVPSEGEADTILGEICRAINRIGYRWYNDGDVYFIGYGKETCGGDAHYLSKCAIEGIRKLFQDATYGDFPTSTKRYEEFIKNLQDEFMKTLKDKKKVKELLQKNTVDSRDMEAIFNYDVEEDIYEVYIIANTDDGSTLMNDDTFEKDWSKCCENAQEVHLFDTENEAHQYMEEYLKYIGEDINKINPIYKDLDVEKMYYSEYGNGILSENRDELLYDMENQLMKEFFH